MAHWALKSLTLRSVSLSVLVMALGACGGGGGEGHHQFDLEGFVLSRLAEAGLARVEALGQDTYSQAETFFSYRRATHRGEPTYGRQISLIAL
jgi:copper oxidase (laccase) domain-containing protein